MTLGDMRSRRRGGRALRSNASRNGPFGGEMAGPPVPPADYASEHATPASKSSANKK
jgi:hypothetical protein